MSLPCTPLVESDALAAALSQPDIRIIDIRYGKDAEQEFLSGHIPGSMHSNYAMAGWRGVSGGVQNVAPDPAHLANLLGGLGITPQHHVIIVSPAENANQVAGAARAYWTLKYVGHTRVSVLNGGFRDWRSSPDRQVQTGPAVPAPAPPYPIRLDDRLRSDLAATERAVMTGCGSMLDARADSFFAGADKSGDVARPGRLPGAVQMDYTRAFDTASGRVQPLDTLRALYAHLPDGPIVNYCNTGHTAALNWFALSELLGHRDVSLFDGSLSVWAQDSQRPLVVAPQG